MSKMSAYEQFLSNELDPVSCLEPAGINDSNKFDVVKLAGVLGSFGDFKDKKYRLKIRRDQAVMIQAVRFLLEKLAAEASLGKHQRDEPAHESTGRKKRRTGYSTGTSTLSTELHDARNTVVDGPHRQNISLQEADVEAALVLQELARKFAKKTEISLEGGFEYNVSGLKDMSKTTIPAMDNISASRTCLTEYTASVQRRPEAHPESTAHWYLDVELRDNCLKDTLVIIRGAAIVHNEWWYGKYEGRASRLISLCGPANEPLAYVKPLKSQSKTGHGPSYSDDREFGVNSSLMIPARYLVLALPEKRDDNVVVLREDEDGPKIKGTHWKVRAFLTGQKREDEFTEDKIADEVKDDVSCPLKLVEVESDLGRLRLPRAHLAKCCSSDE